MKADRGNARPRERADAGGRGGGISETERAFEFGRNWDRFVARALNGERIDIARRHILGFLELPDLRGRSFIDVGCGSGLSSRAALDAGAARITSFDRDPDSVRAAERVRGMSGNPPHWTILRGSVLDDAFIASLGRADIVYAWGVLHHTGRMWDAVERASRLVGEGGLFYLALYTTTPRSGYWVRVKRRYNAASPARRRLMEAAYFLRHTCASNLLHGRNPLAFIRNYRESRGMSYLTDVRDWLGGWPYEDAEIGEVLRFCRNRLGLELRNLQTGRANTEYLFGGGGAGG